jgi:hypothetical protein
VWRRGRLCVTERSEIHQRHKLTSSIKRSASTELFNAEVFVVLPHTITMECDMFEEGRSSHWVMGVGVSKRDAMISTCIAE